MSKKIHYSWVILAMCTLAVFGSLGLARFGYSIILPSMQKGLSLDNTQAGTLATFNLIGYVTLAAIGGALAARFGPRIVITVGLVIAGAGMFMTGLAGSFMVAVAWRTVTGIGSGASNVPAMGLLSSWFGPRRRGMASGVAVAGSSIALIVLGPLIPFVIASYQNNGWRVSWFVLSIMTLIVAITGYLLLRNRPAEKGLKPLGDKSKETDTAAMEDPLHWGSVYKSPIVWLLGFIYIAFGFSYIIYMTFFVKFLMNEGGYTQASAGSLFMIMGWFSLSCGLIWGGISDHIGRKWALIIVYIIQAIAFSLFAAWAVPFGFTISAILFGLTAWSIPAIMAATCGDILNTRMAPAALGFITLFFGLGQALGPAVAGRLADLSGSFHSSFLLAGGVALCGAFGSLLIPAKHGNARFRT